MGEPQGINVDVENIYGRSICNASVSGGGGSCTTDGSGCWYYTRYGTFTVRVTHTGYVEESQSVYVEPEHFEDVNFDVANGHAMYPSIMGVVHDEDGSPLSNMMVWGQGILGTTKYWGCLTQSDGTYSLPLLSAGNFMIRCGKNNYDTMTAVANHSQSSPYPTSTTTINFTGDHSIVRSGSTDPRIAISGRAIVIKDDLDNGYHYTNIEPQTNTVFAKTRKWTGSYLATTNHGDDELRDGYGGSQYE